MASSLEEAATPDAPSGRMRRALRTLLAGDAGRLSDLSLIAVLCASAVAPVALVGQPMGPAITTWLATAGSIGSNLVADVILSTARKRSQKPDMDAAALERAFASELEARMAAAGPEAAALRSAVAGLLREHGAQQVLLEALADGNLELRIGLAESMAMLGGRFDEFATLLVAVRDGIGDLRRSAAVQQAESRAQAEYRSQTQETLDQVLAILREAPFPVREVGVVHNALPPDTAAFVGRQAELDEIIRAASVAATHAKALSIHAIAGMPGVGKSALAVQVAHLLADQFPDRQLFVDLHAHTVGMEPTDPAVALAALLTGDGLDPRQLPTSLEELAALWRARMAGRRTLLVLDNAATSSQIAPLIPGGAGSLVLVTSRRHLGDLPYAVTETFLDVLPPGDAVAMFLRLTPRAANNEEQVAELVALAGCLPLAISLLARVYTKHRAWSMSELIEETRSRLLTLGAEEHTVATAFDLSYQALRPARQRFFRLVGLHPGSDLDPYAAAALTGTSLSQARAHLDALHGDHLLTEASYRRFGMHDLIRTHARAQAESTEPSEQREAALDRVLHYYAHTAQTASVSIARLPRPEPDEPPPTHAPGLADPEVARAWLRAERPNLHAAFAYAQTHGLDEHTIALAAGLAEVRFSDGPWPRDLEVHSAAVDAATRTAQPNAHAAALNTLGRVRYLTGDNTGAADALGQALTISRQTGNRLGEATALILLARVRFTIGDYREAARALEQALNIYRQTGNLLGEAAALDDLGRVRYLTGDFPGASDALTQALEISRRIGFRLSEADALASLGRLWFRTGNLPATRHAQEQALEVFREIGHSGNEFSLLNDYAATIAAIGDHRRALALYQQSLVMNRQLNKPDDEARALEGIAEHHIATGDVNEGAEYLREALQIFQRIGMHPDIARARIRLASLGTASACDATDIEI